MITSNMNIQLLTLRNHNTNSGIQSKRTSNVHQKSWRDHYYVIAEINGLR